MCKVTYPPGAGRLGPRSSGQRTGVGQETRSSSGDVAALVGHAKSHVYPRGRRARAQRDGSQQPLSCQNGRCGPTAGRPIPGTEAWCPPTFGEEPEGATLEVFRAMTGSKDSTEPGKDTVAKGSRTGSGPNHPGLSGWPGMGAGSRALGSVSVVGDSA